MTDALLQFQNRILKCNSENSSFRGVEDSQYV